MAIPSPYSTTIVRNKVQFSAGVENPIVFPKGTLFRVERGAEDPRMAALTFIDADNKVQVLDIPRQYLSPDFEPAEGVAMTPNSALSAEIEVFPALSNETTALRGILRFNDTAIEISCRGDGDPVRIHHRGNSARKDASVVEDAIRQALTSAQVPIPDYFDPVTDFANFVTSMAGLESFSDYMKRQAKYLAELMPPVGPENNVVTLHKSSPEAATSAQNGPLVALETIDMASAIVVLDEAFDNLSSSDAQDDAKHQAMLLMMTQAGSSFRALNDLVQTLHQAETLSSVTRHPHFQAAQDAVAAMAGVSFDDIDPVKLSALLEHHRVTPRNDEDPQHDAG